MCKTTIVVKYLEPVETLTVLTLVQNDMDYIMSSTCKFVSEQLLVNAENISSQVFTTIWILLHPPAIIDDYVEFSKDFTREAYMSWLTKICVKGGILEVCSNCSVEFGSQVLNTVEHLSA